MSKKRPLIGITGPDDGGGAAWFFTSFSVLLAGGWARRITPKRPANADELDALILGGGADVEPENYGQELIEKEMLSKDKRSVFEWILSILLFPVYWVIRFFLNTKSAPIDTTRDKLELILLHDILREGKPVMGICRGMQLMNVHFKGTLHQDISGFYEESPQIASIFPKKRIKIEAESKIASILNTTHCNVNALHNQSIDELGEGVRIVASEVDTDIIQAIEQENHPFAIGVQWHPEYLIQISRQRNIFKELVRVAKTCSTRQTD